MAQINVNFNNITGPVKAMHSVGQPPFLGANMDTLHYLTDANIPHSRLHDVGGMYGAGIYVDIPNIFRDFNADAENPESYDFAFTDHLIKEMIKNNIQPIYRLGVTIENYTHIKRYRTFPPADFHKWAKICEMIIRHYIEGWADGFHYNITYWEIWNEPDNYEDPNENQMWKGTKEQYFELYKVASKHLKACFPHLKIGGYASCGFYAIKKDKAAVKVANSSDRVDYFIEFMEAFFEYIKKENCPLDFFSWHSYDNIENNKKYAYYARKRLDEYGFTDTETTCNEWNCFVKTKGTMFHAANIAGMMLMFQDTPLDSAMIYDAKLGCGDYAPLFNSLTAEPFPAYYTFVAYNELFKRKNQVETVVDTDGIYALTAIDGDDAYMVVANTTENALPLNIIAQAEFTEFARLTENGFVTNVFDNHKVNAFEVLCYKLKKIN